MKVVAFNGSPRPNGNTARLIGHVFTELEAAGIETELVQLSGKKLADCGDCCQCSKRKDYHCAIDNDIVNECIDKMRAADGIILGSPVYFADLTATLKALIDRAGRVAKANNEMFRRKIGAAVVAVRRAGAIQTFNSINAFFLIEQMIVPGSSYWNLGVGMDEGDVDQDDEGIRTMSNLGKNMAWLLEKLHA